MKENKESRRTWILTTLVCLIPILAALILYDKIPEEIVTHWDGAGNPNGWSSRFVGTIVFPGVLLLINMVFIKILKADPKYEKLSGKVIELLHWIIPITSLFASGITLASALGVDVKIPLFGSLFLGLILIMVGNYLPKVSRNYMVGIKLPWTLADEENWDKTHRMAGFVWVVCGILMLICAFFPVRMYALGVLVAVMILTPMAYSYVLWKRREG